MRLINKTIFITILSIFFIASCQKENVNIDKEKPTINIDFPGSSPKNCDTIYFGEPFTLNIQLADNMALGSFNIDIHNNFDHHSHSTEVTECVLNDKKTPINPFVLIKEFAIPNNSKLYKANFNIEIPFGNDKGAYDDGDYHFFISLTDKEGWSSQMGLSIKMLHKK